jgi:predicted GNAT superfamily acetyltransferase
VLFLRLAPYLTLGVTHVEMVLELEEMKNVMMMKRSRLRLVLLEAFLVLFQMEAHWLGQRLLWVCEWSSIFCIRPVWLSSAS